MVEIIVEVANLNKLMKDNQEDMFSEYKSRYFTATNTEKKMLFLSHFDLLIK